VRIAKQRERIAHPLQAELHAEVAAAEEKLLELGEGHRSPPTTATSTSIPTATPSILKPTPARPGWAPPSRRAGRRNRRGSRAARIRPGARARPARWPCRAGGAAPATAARPPAT